jgi:hypothetical protein
MTKQKLCVSMVNFLRGKTKSAMISMKRRVIRWYNPALRRTSEQAFAVLFVSLFEVSNFVILDHA